MLRWRIIYFLCLLWWLGVANAQPVTLDASTRPVELAGQLYASPVQSPPANAQEALAAYRGGRFERLVGNLGRGYTRQPVWLAFDLRTTEGAPDKVVLEVGPAYLDHVEAFTVSAAGEIRSLGTSGDQVPREASSAVALKPSFLLALTPLAQTTLLIRIETSSSQAAIVKLFDSARYPTRQLSEGILFGALIAACAVMLMLTLSLYLASRDRLYLFWIVYMLFTNMVWAMIDGLVYRYLTWMDLKMVDTLTNLASIGSLAAGATFISFMFEFSRLHRRLHQVFVAWSLLALVVGGIGVLASAPMVAASIMFSSMPLFVLALLAIMLQIVRGHGPSRLHGPWLLLYVGAAHFHTMAQLGWLPLTEVSLYAWQGLGLANLISLQAALFAHARKAQADLIHERMLLHKHLSEHAAALEQQVAQRTSDLVQALTQSRIAEQRTQSSEQRFRSLVETMTELVWILDPDTLFFVYVSPTAVRLNSPVRGDSVPGLLGSRMPAQDQQRLTALIRERTRAFRAGQLDQNCVFVDTHQRLRREGGLIDMESRSRFVMDPQTGALRVQGISQDITERLQLERDLKETVRQLQQVESAQRQLLSTASHEFRTPAAKIKASLDSLRLLQAQFAPEIASRLETIRQSTQRLIDLANQLISSDRIREQALRPQKEQIDLCALLASVRATYASDAPLAVRMPVGPLLRVADGILLGTALHNLIDNALQHQPEATSPVLVTLIAASGSVEIRVADAGPGIPDAMKKLVFQRYSSRSGDPRKGLGLSIVREIVLAHGGDVLAQDNRPQGAVMVMTLALEIPPILTD